MKNRKSNHRVNRRSFLLSCAVTAVATGLPAKILLDPLTASANDMPTGKMLIVSTSRGGDPINANVPGTYGFDDVYHSDLPEMAESPITLGDVTTTAAKPWAMLPKSVRNRTCFFHHATYTPVHGELARVQRMMGATDRNDMLISLLARELAPVLGTVQSDPVSLGASGGELLSSAGRILGNVTPLSVRQALAGSDGPLGNLVAIRDQHIDRIYDVYREHGTADQRTMFDAWARSRDEVRSISQALVSRLDEIDGNDELNQAKTAAILIAMKIAPVISIHLNFGGDNHRDTDFENEAARHLTGIDALGQLMAELDALKAEGALQHDVLVATLNVFGRTLKKRGMDGRDHNPGHHCMVLMGDGINGGVVGGIELNDSGKEYIARSIDPQTGAAGGAISYEQTLASAGKTLGYAMGVQRERMDELVTEGAIVESVCG